MEKLAYLVGFIRKKFTRYTTMSKGNCSAVANITPCICMLHGAGSAIM